MENPGVKALIEYEEALRSAPERQNLRWTWELLNLYVRPTRASFIESWSGSKLSTAGVQEMERAILDSTAPQAAELLASSLFSILSNPGGPWVSATIAGKETSRLSVTERQYLERVEGVVMDEMATGQLSYYCAAPEVFMSLVVDGTAIIERMYARDGSIAFNTVPIADAVIDANEEHRVDLVMIRDEVSRRNWRRMFPGADLPPELKGEKRKVGGQKMARARVLRCYVAADDEDLLGDLPGYKPKPTGAYYVVVSVGDRRVVKLEYQRVMKCTVARWARQSGTPYGRSPCMNALGDILMVNRVTDSFVTSVEMLAQPPFQVPYGAVLGNLNIRPYGITETDGAQTLTPLLPPGASRVEMSEGLMRMKQASIREAFAVSLFLQADTPAFTATQALQVEDAQNRALAPRILGLQADLMSPLVIGVLEDKRDRSALPEPPASLRNDKLRFKYMTPTLTAWRQFQATGLLRILQAVGPFAELMPEMFDGLNPDAMLSVAYEASGAPATILAPNDDRDQKRQARAQRQQAEQAQQTAETAEAGASAAQKVAQAQQRGRP